MKVIIRKLRLKDAATSYKWRNDAEVWKHTGSKPDKFITPEIEKEWLAEVLTRKDQKRFAICVNEDQQYVGNVQLTEIKGGEAEFHIFIGEKSYWNKGVGSEATRLIINYGFEQLHLKKITLIVDKENAPAIASYTKCGFVLVVEGQYHLMMAIENEQN
jgi:RimJ/RimL family protein N-acetyltransferase